jgi:hypothetical protein
MAKITLLMIVISERARDLGAPCLTPASGL